MKVCKSCGHVHVGGICWHVIRFEDGKPVICKCTHKEVKHESNILRK